MITELKYKDHEEWLAIRSKYIGGSDASSVVGLNDYKSAYALWCEKTGKVEAFAGNLTTEIGAFLEEKVAELFTKETGKKVQRKNATIINDKYPWACANIDRKVVGENAFLEIKTTTSVPTIKKINNAEEFPECYYAQCLHYMAVGEYDHCYLAVLINCRELKIFELKRDENEIKALMECEKDFWSHVENDTPPMIDGSESTSEAIKERYPQGNGEAIDLSPFDNSLECYFALDVQIKVLKEEQNRIANEIKDYMGETSKGESDNYKISYTTSERKTFDTKAFASAYGNINLEPFYKTSAVRTFKPTKKGK